MASPALVRDSVPAKTLDSGTGGYAPGLINLGPIHANLAPAALTELALRRGEGLLAARGALAAYTGQRTGRSPRDRYILPELDRRDEIHWGPTNQPLDEAAFEHLHAKVNSYLQGRELFITDGWACADPRYRLQVRVIAEKAWHAMFAHCLLLRPPAA